MLVYIDNFFAALTTKKAIIIIFIIGFIVYFSGLFNGFVGDDTLQIVENPIVHSFKNLPMFFSGSTFFNGGGQQLGGAYFRPFVEISFSTIYSLFGSGSFSFHFILILLHIINACLVFLLFRKFFKNTIPFVLSLLFLIHPINSEVAYYISDLQESLFLFFGMMGLWTLASFTSKKALGLAGVSLFFALLSKESAILFIIISIVYTWMFLQKDRKVWTFYILLLTGIYGVLRIITLGFMTQTFTNTPFGKLDLFHRLINVPAIFVFYLRTFIFPNNISSSYHWMYTQLSFMGFFLPLAIGVSFLFVVFLIKVFIHKKYPKNYSNTYNFFAIWFIVGMLLNLQIIPLDQTVAVRWFYFPIIGLLGVLGIIAEAYKFNLKNVWVVSCLSLILLLLAGVTIIRGYDFKDEITLANHDLSVSQNDYNLEFNLSVGNYKLGLCSNALDHAKKSIDKFPTVFNYTALGVAYFCLGEYKPADDSLRKALPYGAYFQTYENLASLALFYGDTQSNIDFIKNQALRYYPQDGQIWTDLAILEDRIGNKSEAKSDITRAAQYTRARLLLYVYIRLMNNKPLNLTYKNANVIYGNPFL